MELGDMVFGYPYGDDLLLVTLIVFKHFALCDTEAIDANKWNYSRSTFLLRLCQVTSDRWMFNVACD